MYANPAPTTNMAYGSQGPVQGQYKMQGYQPVQPEQGYQPVQPAFAPMMQQQQQQGPSVILVQQQAPNLYRQPVYENMSRQQLIVSGVLQIIVGSLSFAINIMSRVVGSSLSVIGIGFWAGIIYIVTGSIAIMAAQQKTKPSVIASATLAVISSVLAIIMLAICAAGLDWDVKYKGNYGYSYYYYYDSIAGWYDAQIAANSILIILAVAELSFAVWQCVISFYAICNSQPTMPSSSNVIVPMVTQPQQQHMQQQFAFSVPQASPPYSAVPQTSYAAAAPPYNPPPQYDNSGYKN